MKILKSLFNCVRLGRPYYVLPVVATALAGYLCGPDGEIIAGKLVALCSAFAFLGMSCWSANEIADSRMDALGKTKIKWGFYVSGGTSLVASGLVSTRVAAVYTGILVILGLGIAAVLGSACWWLCVAFLALGMAYSFEPLRLKDRGILGVAAVAGAYGIAAFAAGSLAGGHQFTGGSVVFAVMMSVTFFGLEGIPHLIDHDQDRANGEKTLAVSLGRARTGYLLVLCQCLPAVLLLVASLFRQTVFPRTNLPLLVVVLVASVLVALVTITRKEESSLSAIRILSVPLMSAFGFLLA